MANSCAIVVGLLDQYSDQKHHNIQLKLLSAADEQPAAKTFYLMRITPPLWPDAWSLILVSVAPLYI